MFLWLPCPCILDFCQASCQFSICLTLTYPPYYLRKKWHYHLAISWFTNLFYNVTEQRTQTSISIQDTSSKYTLLWLVLFFILVAYCYFFLGKLEVKISVFVIAYEKEEPFEFLWWPGICNKKNSAQELYFFSFAFFFFVYFCGSEWITAVHWIPSEHTNFPFSISKLSASI